MISIRDKILFLNLDFGESKISVKDTMGGLGEIYENPKFLMPITDFLIGATIFYEKGYNISVVDNEIEKMERKNLISKVLNGGYSAVFLRTSLPTLNKDLIFINKLKKFNETIKVCILAPFISKIQGELEKSKIDYFISEESEFAFLDIAGGLKISEIKGLGYRKEKKLIYNGERKYNGDLNLLPHPKWDLVDYKKYSFVTCSTSKGCPYACGYCPYPVYQGRRWRSKNIDLVIKELNNDYFHYGIKYLRFRDPEFTLNRQRTLEICKRIIENNIKIKWHAETRLDLLDRELLEAMSRAGCVEISFGIETINEKTRKIINRKKIDDDKINEVLKDCQNLGIKTFGFFIIGLPEENKKTTLDLIKFSLEIDSYLNEFTIATPYPGTFLRKWAEEKNLLIPGDYSFYTSAKAMMTNGFLTKNQLKDLCKFANLANRIKLREKKKINFRIKTLIYQQLQNVEYIYLKNKIKFI